MLFKLFPMCYPFKYVKFELNQLFQFTISLFYKLVVSVDLLPDNGLFILPKSVLSIAKSHLKILLIRVSIYLKFFHWKVFLGIDAVNQGNWSLSIKLRLVYFVIAKKCKHYAKALTYSQNDSKIQGCLRCQCSKQF